MSIHNVLQKINPFRIWLLIPDKIRLDIVIILLIVLSGVLAFGIGRLSGLKTIPKDPVHIQTDTNASSELSLSVSSSKVTQNIPPSLSTSQSGTVQSASVVASKQGTKYHYAWCSGAKTIVAKNKITFASAEAATKAGYTLASNCK